MPEIITSNFDLWTSAMLTKSSAGRGRNGKLEAYGIKKLRELILELAVLGKLVPQDPNEEPASVLLKRIAKEKARLVKEGKIKREKPLSEATEETIPFTLPANWVWARLPDVCTYKVGKTPSTKNPNYWSEDTDGAPWVSISDMEHFGVVTDTSKRISEEAAEKVFGYEPIPKGSLLMSFKLTVGKTAILGIDAYHNEAIISLQPFSGIARDYLFKVLPARAQEGNTKRAIMGNTLNATSLSQLLIPVPPLGEQHRIIAKVDELMALCDQLEQQQADGIEAHQTLVEILLGTLTNVASQKEVNDSWIRIASHFDTLFTTEHSIEQLKKTILQLAVMGKLVRQDANEEPASVLLKRIAEEKARLIKEGKIKQEKPLSEISEKTIPFTLPPTWVWARLPDISTYKVGKTPSTKNTDYWAEDTDAFPWVSISDMEHFGVVTDTSKRITKEAAEKVFDYEPIPKGSLLMSFKLTVGKTAILGIDAYHNEAIISIQPYSGVARDYLLKVLPTRAQEGNAKRAIMGNTLNGTSLSQLLIPVPPLAEQHRIIAKVTELMALCDTLNARLTAAQATQVHLVDTVVERAVA